ncbi:hypothetical protein LguiA_011280 [Lonicera macranthoides]
MSVPEMVALSAAHSIGVTHCGSFAGRLCSFNNTLQDWSLSAKYASFLKKKCSSQLSNGHANLDFSTPNSLDNQYYVGLKKNMALLPSDQAFPSSPLTAGIVKKYMNNATLRVALQLQCFEASRDDECGPYTLHVKGYGGRKKMQNMVKLKAQVKLLLGYTNQL